MAGNRNQKLEHRYERRADGVRVERAYDEDGNLFSEEAATISVVRQDKHLVFHNTVPQWSPDFEVAKLLLRGSGATYMRDSYTWRLPVHLGPKLIEKLRSDGFLIERAKGPPPPTLWDQLMANSPYGEVARVRLGLVVTTTNGRVFPCTTNEAKQLQRDGIDFEPDAAARIAPPRSETATDPVTATPDRTPDDGMPEETADAAPETSADHTVLDATREAAGNSRVMLELLHAAYLEEVIRTVIDEQPHDRQLEAIRAFYSVTASHLLDVAAEYTAAVSNDARLAQLLGMIHNVRDEAERVAADLRNRFEMHRFTRDPTNEPPPGTEDDLDPATFDA